ncbi:hypothetical protein ACFLZF_00670 [Nanoarchaeota archaeon]
MNNRGWIRIVEAFFAILLVAGTFLIAVNQGYVGQENTPEIYNSQLSVLREIQLDDTLREKILEINNDLIIPNGLEDDHSEFPPEIKTKINERTPNSLICRSKICELEVICELNKYVDKDIYVQPVAITSNLEKYSPRQLKLFCWYE